MPERDDIIELIDGASVPELDLEIGVAPIQGRAIVVMYREEMRNGLHLPVSGRCSADVGRLTHDLPDYGLVKGDIVGVRPYRGVWFDMDGRDVRFFGSKEDLDFALICVWRDEWLALPPYSLVQTKTKKHEFLLLRESEDKTGEIVNTLYDYKGKVAFDPYQMLKVNGVGEGLVFVKDVQVLV